MPLEAPVLSFDSLHELLPPNATKLEQDLLKLIPFDSVLQAIVSEVNTIGETAFPSDWKVWFLQERGQLPLLEAIGDIDLVITNSVYLMEHAGTEAAVIRVCHMLGYPNAAVWEHEWPTIQFGEFQIYLGKLIANQTALVRLEKAVKAVKPTRSRLRRVYSSHDNDVRRTVLNRIKSKQSAILNHNLLGHFSGFASVHNPYLWVSSVEETSEEINLTLSGGELSVIDFPYSDTGTLSGIMTDGAGDEITDEDGTPIYLVSYTFPE